MRRNEHTPQRCKRSGPRRVNRKACINAGGRSGRRRSCAVAWSVVLGLSLWATATCAADLRILIPLYAYPEWYQPADYIWDDVAQGAAQVPITAIINPDNGPGTDFPNSDYAHGLADLATGGVTVVGYVYSSYGARNLAAVKNDVDRYTNSPLVTGIFVDEAASDTNALAYYQDLYAYIHAHPNFATVIVNPGNPIAEEYLRLHAADTAVIFENKSGWSNDVADAYVTNYPPRYFSALVYGCADTEEMRRDVDLAAHRNVGWVYVTDDDLSNPWDRLPSYWSALVGHVAAYRNLRATGIAATAGGVALTFTAVSNRPAQVEWSSALPATNWTPCTNVLVPTGTVIEATDTRVTAGRFYRLRLLSP